MLTAFFLEATFLGVMLFGWKRVPPWLHVTSAILVAFGTTVSGFWILSANSWMHTPAGHVIRDGIAYPVALVGNRLQPELPLSLRAHDDGAAYLTTSVVVLRSVPATCCWQLSDGRQNHDAHGARDGRHPGPHCSS
ncbi:MAG: cytochrome ubiquinol oxidase subunit I [Gammaproteobacteria bacterium]